MSGIPENLDSAELQDMLEDFNKVDKRKQGSVKITEAVRLLREKTSIKVFNDDLMDRIIFTTEKFVTFDEFLALLYEAELDAGIHNNLINYRMVEFLKLLEDYRKKCQEASMYSQANKAHQKTLQIKDKEMRRHKQKLLLQQKSKVISVNSLQQNKLVEFNQAWNEYMNKYEGAALNSIEKLKAKHLTEIEKQQDRIRAYYQNYLKPSKRILDLKVKQKLLVKQKQYMEAQKIKRVALKMEEKQREVKNQQINERIKKRKQTLQKHQEACLMAHLKRIQKDRNDQMKKRQTDSQQMLIKLKNIQNDIVQKQSVQIKETLSNLRQTMCLTSGQLFKSKIKRKAQSSTKIENLTKSKIDESGEKKSSFKIRINSFHRTKMDQSMYDP